MTDAEPLLKVAEVCTKLRLSPRTIRKFVKAGKLKAYQLPGGHWRITVASVNACLRELRS